MAPCRLQARTLVRLHESSHAAFWPCVRLGALCSTLPVVSSNAAMLRTSRLLERLATAAGGAQQARALSLVPMVRVGDVVRRANSAAKEPSCLPPPPPPPPPAHRPSCLPPACRSSRAPAAASARLTSTPACCASASCVSTVRGRRAEGAANGRAAGHACALHVGPARRRLPTSLSRCGCSLRPRAGPIDDHMSNLVVAQLLYLESENPERPVRGCGVTWLVAASGGRPAARVSSLVLSPAAAASACMHSSSRALPPPAPAAQIGM